MRVALTSAIAAALAAVAALKAGHTANEAMIAQMESANQWNYFQAKSIKAAVLRGKIDVLSALNKPTGEKDSEKLKEYEADQEEIKNEAEHFAKESRAYLRRHTTFSHAVTLFQISIAVAAMSIMVRKRRLFGMSLIFVVAGSVFLALGLLNIGSK